MAYRFNEIITNTIDDLTDDSKKLILDLSGGTTGTITTLQFTQTANRIISFPDASGTIILSTNNLLNIPQVVIVKNSNAGNGEFTDIATAVASITDASTIKPYVVKIYPGVYITSGTIVIPSSVSVIGIDNGSCIVSPTGDFSVFQMSELTRLSEIGITNGGTTSYAIYGRDVGIGCMADNITLINCPYNVKIHGAAEPLTLMGLRNITMGGTGMKVGIYVTDTSGTEVSCQLDSITISGHVDSAFMIEGTAVAIIENSTFGGDGSGNCFEISNGAQCDARSIEIIDYTNGFVTTDTILNNPRFNLSSILFNGCTNNINIKNKSTTGKYDGVTEYTKTIINPFSTFFLSGSNQNIIDVAESGGDFASISDAVDAINPEMTVTTLIASTTLTSIGMFNAALDGVSIIGMGIPVSTTVIFIDENTMTLSNVASASGTTVATFVRAIAANVFTIRVVPGIYIEPNYIIPEYVSILGSDQSTTIIRPIDPSGTFITMSDNSTFGNALIQNVTGGIGILFDGANASIQNLTITNCQICIKCMAATKSCSIEITNCSLIGSFNIGILIDGTVINTGSNAIDINSANINWKMQDVGSTAISIAGPNAIYFARNSYINGFSMAGTIGVNIEDGAEINIIAGIIDDVDTGLIANNVGSGPNITINGSVITQPITYAVNILHPGSTGVLSMVAERSQVFVAADSTISIDYTDPVVNGKTIIGSVFLGRNNEDSTDIIELTTEVPGMGLINGGNLLDVSGLSVDVSGGYGYLSTGFYPDQILKKIMWNTQSFVLTANMTEYIYFDSNGSLTKNQARPSTISNILLGRVRTDVSGIEIIDAAPMNTYHIANAFDDYQREVNGSIFASGSIVTANASRELAISSGKYFLSENAYNPSGQASPAVFTSYFHNGSTSFDKTGGVTVVDNSQYDNGTNLVPMGSFSVATILIDTVNTSTTITSSAAFSASFNGLLITCPGIPNGTHATFVDANTMTIDNAAIANGTGVSAKFIVDIALTIGKTDLSDNITSAGLFTSDFIGATISGTGIPASTTVLSVSNANNAVISNPVSGTGSISATFEFVNLYAKHSFYLVGQGINEQYMLVYSQATYTSLNTAQGGSLPAPPTYFTDGIVIIASTIILDGSGSFVSVISERPLPSFSAAAVSSSIFHSSLLGLLNDDHPQYLLVNGTRAMANDFDMGNFSIINVDLIDGVNVATHATRHLPNGGDALTTAAPITNLTATTINAVGTANSLARSDHLHAITTGTASSLTPDLANATGTSASLARADHIHNVATAAPISQVPNSSNAVGVASTFARSDHVHNVPTAAPTSQTPDQSNADGVASTFSKSDHVHNIATATVVSIGTTNSQGSASTFTRSDHVHQGIHSLKANAGGLQRFGDIILAQGAGTTIVDNGSGTFTIDTITGGNELSISSGAGLSANFTAGRVNIDGTITNISASSILLTALTTNGTIFVNTSGVVAQSTATTFAPNVVPLAIYTTGGASISSITDKRIVLNGNIEFGLVADITNITATASASAGTTNKYAMADHVHTISTAAPSTQTPDQINATGTSASLARADHIHTIDTAAPIANITATTTNSQGAATSFARSDHGHAVSTGVPSSQSADQSNAVGTSANLARADHIHNIPTATPVTQNADQSNTQGVGTTFAKSDHIHNIPTATPSSIGSANAQGSANTFTKSDHVHQGIHSLKANSGGTQRFGDLVLQQGNGTSIVDNGSGTFTVDTTFGPNELLVSTGAGLNANYTAGKVVINNTISSISASSIALTASTTNGTIFVNSSGVVTQSTTTTFSSNVIPMATYVTGVAAITSITDVRTFINKTRTPTQLHMKFGTGAAGNISVNVTAAGAVTPTAWVSSAVFIFKGAINNTTAGIFGIIYTSPGGTTVFETRIQDVTNALTIATITGIAGAVTEAYVETTTFTNIPAADAICELQFRRSAGTNNSIPLFAMYLQY